MSCILQLGSTLSIESCLSENRKRETVNFELGKEVEHQSEGLTFVSSERLKIFSSFHARDKTKNTYFFTEPFGGCVYREGDSDKP